MTRDNEAEGEILRALLDVSFGGEWKVFAVFGCHQHNRFYVERTVLTFVRRLDVFCAS
jgi:hypothetical protein